MMRHPVHANGVTRWVNDEPMRPQPAPELKERVLPILRLSLIHI